MAGGGATSEARYVQLDAVRAVAVLGVALCHTMDPIRQQWAEWGAEGVRRFFVVSGFLITGILLDARTQATQLDASRGGVLRAFYARRFLRIFPAYYATLAVAAIIGVAGVRETLGWNVAYLANWQIAAEGHWGVATHTWSLAVEEQFYLLWPLVILFAPRRALVWVAGAMVLLGPATRAVLTWTTDMWSDGITILTPSTFDALGIGALLAMLWRSTLPVDRIVNRVAAVALVIFVAERAIIHWVPAQVTPATTVLWSLFFIWCVHHTARGVGGPIGRILSFRPLLFIGTVSYGVYLFHIFVMPASEIFERKTSIGLPLPESWGWARFVAVTIITVATAALSWTLFERPINSRKQRFPYISRSERPADAVAGVSRPAVPPPGRIAFAGQGSSGGEWSEPGPGGG